MSNETMNTQVSSSNKIYDFYKNRFVFFGISFVIMVVGLVFMFTKGVQLDIQFKGGAMLKYTYEGTLDSNKAADVASELLGRPVTTQTTTDIANGTQRLIINISGNYGVEASEQDEFDSSLKEEFPENSLILSESSMVEPYFGKKFLREGMTALIISFLLVLLYVGIRFRKIGGLSAGVMAIVALIHDVFVVFFVHVIFQIPIGDSFVAVALSIIGYSVNDTIVIYDRIRENAKTYTHMAIDKITNLSINQSMSRSINTNIAVLFSVSIVYILAHLNSLESIESFALPMAIGSISGCYSTICIAGPLWVMWKKRNKTAVAEKK